MPSLKQIRNRIKTINSTSKVTHTMELISAIKFQRFVRVLEYSDEYIQQFKNYLNLIKSQLRSNDSIADMNSKNNESLSDENIFSDFNKQDSIYKTNLVLLINSDKGLNGEFMSLIRKFVTENFLLQNTEFIVVGKKIVSFLRKNQLSIFEKRELGTFGIADLTAQEIFNFLLKLENFNILTTKMLFVSFKKPGKLSVEYDYIFDQDLLNFLSISTQEQILDDSNLDSIYSSFNVKNSYFNFKFEPSLYEVAKYCLFYLGFVKIYNAILHTFTAENFSRMLFMKNATKNANEIKDKLVLKYNKTRQEIITKEINEIVSGGLSKQIEYALAFKQTIIYI